MSKYYCLPGRARGYPNELGFGFSCLSGGKSQSLPGRQQRSIQVEISEDWHCLLSISGLKGKVLGHLALLTRISPG